MATERVWPRGLAARLLIGQTIALVVGGITAIVAAAMVGPTIFHRHLTDTGHAVSADQLSHIELAYRDAALISLGIGLILALVAAAGVTWFFGRRIRRPFTALIEGARELSRGHYETRVPDDGPGVEFATLAQAFNTMAQQLEGVEETRRRLLSDLAHELRTPIATLSAYHDGLHDGVVEIGSESRAVLADQTNRLTRLAEDINEVSSVQERRLDLNLRTHAVASLLSAARDTMRDRYVDHGVDLVVEVGPSIGLRVEADRERVGQVLSNLLANALRHTPIAGTVLVSARQVGREVVISVTDNGEGIAPEQLPHVFERFYRGDAARRRDQSGSGIGLTISRAIVDAHGGTMAALSPGLGRGATFTFTLPAASQTVDV